MNDAYTPEVLANKCPVCLAVGKCLMKKLDGSEYMEQPHPERVAAAEHAQREFQVTTEDAIRFSESDISPLIRDVDLALVRLKTTLVKDFANHQVNEVEDLRNRLRSIRRRVVEEYFDSDKPGV